MGHLYELHPSPAGTKEQDKSELRSAVNPIQCGERRKSGDLKRHLNLGSSEYQ